MAIVRSSPRARAWKWSIGGGSVAAFLVMAQVFHVGDASRPSTPPAASAPAPAGQLMRTSSGATLVCVPGPYGYSCTPASGSTNAGGGYGTYGSYGGGYGGTFANTRSSGS